MVTVMDPAFDAAIIRFEFLETLGVSVRLEGLRIVPLVTVVNATTPLKLLILVRVRVVELENPASTVID
jgi:hypothetical protein